LLDLTYYSTHCQRHSATGQTAAYNSKNTKQQQTKQTLTTLSVPHVAKRLSEPQPCCRSTLYNGSRLCHEISGVTYFILSFAPICKVHKTNQTIYLIRNSTNCIQANFTKHSATHKHVKTEHKHVYTLYLNSMSEQFGYKRQMLTETNQQFLQII